MSDERPEGFGIGVKIRYKPGQGTYGYEDMVEEDGRCPGVVIGYSPTRCYVALHSSRTRRTVKRYVEYRSLQRVEPQE